MALLALRPESAAVDIGLRMAAAANHRGFDDILGSDVALRAADGRMRAGQWKTRARGMIEVPQVPAIGGMTEAAFLAQCAFMGVLPGVTVVATLRRLAEVLVRVTLSTGHGDV